MDDLISRQEAIDAIEEIESEVEDGDGFLYEKWRQYFCELPSAEPQRKTGRWYKPKEYPRDSYRYICTNCHDVAYFVTGNNGKNHKEENPKCGYRFCPNCGAEMKEGAE